MLISIFYTFVPFHCMHIVYNAKVLLAGLKKAEQWFAVQVSDTTMMKKVILP